MAECAELELLYPDWELMRIQIGLWSRIEQDSWAKLYRTVTVEYNPIHNYDRTEEWLDKETRDFEKKEEYKPDLEDTVKDTAGQTITKKTSGSSVLERTAFDTQTFAPTERSVPDVQEQDSGSGTNTTVTERQGSATTRTSDEGSGTNERKGRAFGNIGVTTTQQMLQAEREIALFTIYDAICTSFKKRFCIMVW